MKIKFQDRIFKDSKWSHGGPRTLTIEAWRLHTPEICIPVVADSHHVDEERDPDPHPHYREKSDPDPHSSEKKILDPDPH